jgi:hypothetical protein
VIPLRNRLLVLRVPLMNEARADDVAHFVDLAAQSVGRNKAGELLVDEGGGHAEGVCHRGDGDASVLWPYVREAMYIYIYLYI